MKIIFMGSAESNHTIRWVNALAERGHKVLLVCRGDQREKRDEISSTVKIHYLKFGGGLGYYLNALEFKRILRKFRPDIINAHYVTGYGTLARIANARPLILSCYGSDVYSFPYQKKWNLALLRKNLDWADAVASTSKAMAEQVKKVMGRQNMRIAVTPFGVDTDLFAPAPRKEHKNPMVGIVKYLEPVYDIELLIRAFKIVLEQSDDQPVLSIYGGGSLEGELKKLAQKLGIGNFVYFHDTIPNAQVPAVLNTFDVFVNCSKMESFGVTVVEAMSCECPVVVTETAGYKEIVMHGVTGIVLKDRKPQTMADAILELLKDPQKRRAYGWAGRKRVKELYDWNSNVDRMEKLYQRVWSSYGGNI